MRILHLFLIVVLLFQNCISPNSDEKIIGVKIYKHHGDFETLIDEWKSIGINTAFVSKELLARKSFREIAEENQIKTFVILPIFFDELALSEDSSLYAIKSNGEKAIDEWVKFVCPSNLEFRKNKIESIVNLVAEYNPDGISIDFIRHFVFWEKVLPDTPVTTLPNTCFCNECVHGFQQQFNIDIPDSLRDTQDYSTWIIDKHSNQWTDWKCLLITSMIEEIVTKTKKVKSNLLVNVHIVPWKNHDFGNGIKKIAGQDILAISAKTNYISPMTYSHMVKQDASWVHDVIDDFYLQTKGKILPSIQVKEAYVTDSLIVAEFEDNLISALLPPSFGVVFWSWEHLEQDSWKKEIISKLVN